MTNIKKTAGSAIAWDLGGTFFQQGISFVISIFLARLLAPAEFGIIGMSLVFINLLQAFTDFGFASALVQNKNNTSLTYSSVFYVNIFSGIVLFLVFQLTAPLIAQFYRNEHIETVVRILSLNLIITSLNIVQRTILIKNINFRTLTIRGVIAQSIGGIVGIYLAFTGWGLYALVAQVLVASLMDTLILWKVTDWYPKFEFSFPEVKRLTGFSSYIFLSQLLNQFISRLDTLIIGRVFNPTTVGFYTRADSLNTMVTKYSSASVTKVFYPVLSSLQDDDEKFQAILLKLQHLVAFLSFLLTGIMVFAGQDIIRVLFGEKWLPSVLIFQVIALKSFAFPMNSIIINAFLAKGKSKENFWFGNVRRLIVLPAYLIAAYFSFNAFLWTVTGVSYANWLFNNFIVTRYLNIPLRKQFNTVVPYLLIFVSGYLLITAIFYYVQHFMFIGSLKSVIYILYFIGANYLLKTVSFNFVRTNGISSWGRLQDLLKKA